MALVGYARVSTVDQDTALQQDALRAYGVDKLVIESGSGVGPRPRLHAALRTLGAGDVLVVWKVDRVARSLVDLLSILERLRVAGASVKSLTEPIDTSSPIGEFTFQILGAVAQLERSMIRERVLAGQAAARARGVYWGRKAALSDDEQAQMALLYGAGGWTLPTIADYFGVSWWVARRAVAAYYPPSFVNPRGYLRKVDTK